MASSKTTLSHAELVELVLSEKAERERLQENFGARIGALEKRLQLLSGDPGYSDPPIGQSSATSSEGTTSSDEEAKSGCPPKRASLFGFDLSSRGERLTGANLDDKNAYEWNGSTWDMCVFCGLGCVGKWASIIVAVLAFTAGIVQVYFLYTMVKSAEDPLPGEALAALMHFRLTFAQDVQYADPEGRYSLAASVCDPEDQYKTPLAGAQKGLVAQLQAAAQGGHRLVLLALLCWTLVIVGELDNVYLFVRALWHLPRGVARTSVAALPDGTIQVRSITRGRFWALVLTVALPRIAIAGGLLHAGCLWVLNTLDRSAILTNALGLAFVLDVDELIFKTLAPRRIVALQDHLEPLSLPVKSDDESCWAKLMRHRTVHKAIFVLAYLTFLMVTIVRGLYTRVDQAIAILCSGNQNFVVGENPATGALQVAPLVGPGAVLNLTDYEKAVLQVTEMKIIDHKEWPVPPHISELLSPYAPPMSHILLGAEDSMRYHEYEHNKSAVEESLAPRNPAWWFTQIHPNFSEYLRLKHIAAGTVEDVMESAVCKDFDLSPPSAQTFALEQYVKNATSCKNVSRWCGSLEAVPVRAICSLTCGCQLGLEPPAGFYAAEHYGCPATCVQGVDVTLTRNTDLACADSPVESFYNNKWLIGYFKQVFHKLRSRPDTFEALVHTLELYPVFFGIKPDQVANLAWSFLNGTTLAGTLRGDWSLAPGIPHPTLARGCDFWLSDRIRILLQVDLCEAKGRFRSLRPICPQKCDCRRGYRECPGSCPQI